MSYASRDCAQPPPGSNSTDVSGGPDPSDAGTAPPALAFTHVESLAYAYRDRGIPPSAEALWATASEFGHFIAM